MSQSQDQPEPLTEIDPLPEADGPDDADAPPRPSGGVASGLAEHVIDEQD
jgi:hypothetical protein